MNKNLIEINGHIDSWGYQRSNLKWRLSEVKGPVTVRISSYGGDINEAMKISQMLADRGDVTVQFLGMCASCVTWMAYGADKVQIAEDALWLCHKSSTVLDIYGSLNSDELDAKIAELQKCKKTNEALDLIIAKKYADRAKAPIKDMMKLMEEERWLTAKEVKNLGLVDEVIKASGIIKNLQNMYLQNCADLGLPVPHFDDDNEKSLIDSFLDKCKSLLTSSGGIPASQLRNLHFQSSDGEEHENQIINNNENIIMNKSFVSVNTLLSVEGFAENEGKVSLTVDQMKAINDALAANGDTADKLKTANDSLQKANDDLKKVADILDAIEDNKSIEGLCNKAQSLVNFIKRVPLAANVVPAAGSAKDEFKECKDPINSINQ